MSKPWTPSKPTVELRPKGSRIRREPVRLVENVAAAKPRTAVRTRSQEMWATVTGIVFFAALIVAAVTGIAVATILHDDDPRAEARALQYDQCYNGGQNCVVDGGTIYVAGEKVVIARVDAARIQGAGCPQERDRGIDTAVRLANFLNKGDVTLGAPSRDSYGRQVRTVEVKGQDVANWMIATGAAREYLGSRSNWCGGAS